MQFMVIERFRDTSSVQLERHQVTTISRDLPFGLNFVNSWIEPRSAEIVHLMECDDQEVLQKWVQPRQSIERSIDIVPVL
jgi:hypothetical protein